MKAPLANQHIQQHLRLEKQSDNGIDDWFGLGRDFGRYVRAI